LAAGEVIEVFLDSRVLPVWSGKLGFSMSIQRTRDREEVQAYVVAETPTREWRRDLRDSLSPADRSDAAHTTRSMRNYTGRYSSGHE
jgi:hypothetical protein